jgi:glycosyltransferase involved in cell wall biosynthesis
MNAAVLMAESGWNVSVLTAPIEGFDLAFSEHAHIEIHAMPERPSHVMSKLNYLRYTARALQLARTMRPDVVYASDQLGGGAGLLAAKATGAHLVYHEHDSPEPDAAWSLSRSLRTASARRADAVILPNAERGRLAQAEIGFSMNHLHIIWNMPRKSEVPSVAVKADQPMIVYYHGSITPERLPLTAIDAVCRFQGAVRLRFAGYEVAGSEGYIRTIEQHGIAQSGEPLVQYLGQVPSHSDLLAQASQTHIGLALMPPSGGDVNMQNMTGASNKVFEYMSVGLAALVSDLPDWRREFVTTGFARACDPARVESIAAALSWFRDNPGLRREIGERNRAKILADWNYETAFAPLRELFDGWVND